MGTLVQKPVQITPVMRAIRPVRSSPQVCQVVLLAGGVRSRGFRAQLGRHILNLPMDGKRDLLNLWEAEVAGMSEHFGWNGIQLKVLVDEASPVLKRGEGRVQFSIERDTRGFRGTGGILRDACGDVGKDEYVLVCNAFQILCTPLTQVVERLSSCDGALSFESEPGGVGGVFLVKGDCISAIPSMGFVDFKEQAIRLIANSHRVQVIESTRGSGLPVRSLAEYVKALRSYHGSRDGGFCVVEPGAVVGEGSRLHDSVVLNGGWVGSKSILAGSLVTAGGVVAADERVVHQIVSSTGTRIRGMA